MKRTLIACLISSMFGMGCAVGAPEGEEAIGVAEEAYVAQNTLFPNTLFPNTLFPNALSPSAISVGALSYSSLPQASQTAITDPGPAGDLSRMFLKYAVKCAFSPGQSFTFSWSGSQQPENYEGEVGLAPGWEDGPLNDTEKTWSPFQCGALIAISPQDLPSNSPIPLVKEPSGVIYLRRRLPFMHVILGPMWISRGLA